VKVLHDDWVDRKRLCVRLIQFYNLDLEQSIAHPVEKNGTVEQGYLHCGSMVRVSKMVHNGIEYGIMAAYARGLSIFASRQ